MVRFSKMYIVFDLFLTKLLNMHIKMKFVAYLDTIDNTRQLQMKRY